MKIPLDARVQCTDDLGGTAVMMIINPINRKMTHVVVEERRPPNIERLVPIQFIARAAHDQIHLNCSRQELGQLTPLIESEFMWAKIPGFKNPTLTFCTHTSLPRGA